MAYNETTMKGSLWNLETHTTTFWSSSSSSSRWCTSFGWCWSTTWRATRQKLKRCCSRHKTPPSFQEGESQQGFSFFCLAEKTWCIVKKMSGWLSSLCGRFLIKSVFFIFSFAKITCSIMKPPLRKECHVSYSQQEHHCPRRWCRRRIRGRRTGREGHPEFDLNSRQTTS